MESLLQFFMAYMLVFLVIAIAIYIAVGIFLNKFNKLVYGKGTPMAFIPIVNTYLLGKLTIGKPVGLILVFATLITGTFTTNINGVENSYTLFSDDVSSKINMVVSIVTFGLFIYAIFLYFKLKKGKNNGNHVNDNKGPLDNNKTDVISNIIDSSRDTININRNNNASTEQNLNTNINNNTNTDINYSNAKASDVVNTVDSNISNNNQPSEFMKQYQNNDNNN